MDPDYTSLSATHQACFAPIRGWTADELKDLATSAGGILLGDAACFVLARVTLDEAEILTLATHPNHQRQGRARRTLTDLEHLLPPDAASLFLEVAADNSAALGLYASLGFSHVGRRARYYTPPGAAAVDALILRKHLSDHLQS